MCVCVCVCVCVCGRACAYARECVMEEGGRGGGEFAYVQNEHQAGSKGIIYQQGRVYLGACAYVVYVHVRTPMNTKDHFQSCCTVEDPLSCPITSRHYGRSRQKLTSFEIKDRDITNTAMLSCSIASSSFDVKDLLVDLLMIYA